LYGKDFSKEGERNSLRALELKWESCNE